MSLIGKFVHFSNGEYYKTGEIVEQIDAGCNTVYLVKFDNMINADCPAYSALYHVGEMLNFDGKDIKAWSFFSSREELQQWADFLDVPKKEDDEDNVVSILKN